MPCIFTRAAWTATLSLVVGAAVARCETVEPTGEASLAWRLDSLSTGLLGPDRPSAAFKLSASLLRGAEILTPDQSRFPRLQVLALMQAGNTDEAIAALVRYRKLNPADPMAQVQLVDLYASKQETLDDKLKYLSETADNQKLQLLPEVRSRLATEAALLLAQKSPELAGQMAAKAVKFYPLPGATELYYRYIASSQQLPERVAGLLAVLRANPVQVGYLTEMASLLADNGLADESLHWYEQVTSVVRDSRLAPPGYHNLRVDYAAEWAIAGKLPSADNMAAQMLNEQPLDADAWFLRLTVARAQSEEAYKSALDLARTAFIERWNRMHGEIMTGHAATQPAVPPGANADANGSEKIQPLDPAPVIDKVKKPGNESMKAAAISVASDVAWFDLYFDRNADAAGKWIEVLRALLPPDSQTLQRLLGWQVLVANHPAKARDILSKIARDDPLSELGTITADQQENKPIDSNRIPSLLDQNRVGLVGAMLWTSFKNESERPKARPNSAAVQAELKQFPPSLFAVADPRQTSRVYTVQAEPLQTTYDYGTPVLARVSIENISNVDLTFGSDALIQPDLWFDAQTLGIGSQVFQGVAFDQLQGVIVLQPHHQASQLVRLDEGKLRQLLHNSAAAQATTVNCYVITNPIPLRDRTTGQEVGMPGPGGAAVGFFRTFTYSGVPLSLPAGQQWLAAALAGNSAVQKIHAVDLMASYIRQGQKPAAAPEQHKLAGSLPPELIKLRRDPMPLVSGWASYVSASLAETPEEAKKIASEMAASPQWSTRLLSVLAGGARPASMRREVASRLANDPDPVVKSAASAMLEWIEQSPAQSTETTQPTTAPAVH